MARGEERGRGEIRPPAVAGTFYERDPEALRRQVRDCSDPDASRAPALALQVPHAGLIYSGKVAGATYSRVSPPAAVILLGPNHRGLGGRAVVSPPGFWRTPLGEVRVDEELAGELRSRFPELQEYPRAHAPEHCLEVQVPFLQVLLGSPAIVPILLCDWDEKFCRELGEALGETVRAAQRSVLIVASSDMSHYVPDEVARERDRLALERVLALDAPGLLHVVEERGISMCGAGPVAAAMAAAKALGAERAELSLYTTSGDTSGDRSAVVGYAGVVFG